MDTPFFQTDLPPGALTMNDELLARIQDDPGLADRWGHTGAPPNAWPALLVAGRSLALARAPPWLCWLAPAAAGPKYRWRQPFSSCPAHRVSALVDAAGVKGSPWEALQRMTVELKEPPLG